MEQVYASMSITHRGHERRFSWLLDGSVRERLVGGMTEIVRKNGQNLIVDTDEEFEAEVKAFCKRSETPRVMVFTI